MNIHKLISTALLFLIPCGYIQAQEKTLPNPFDFPILLSGNFAELRANHFHSGIDFKTQGAEGKPIHAVQDGYVSRISVSPWGYGNCLYLTHPDGTTTVYGHLQGFSKEVAAYVLQQQYAQEKFAVNLFPTPEQFPVKKGEIIARSGNSGSSGGPHLHFEVRDTRSEDILDPLPFFKGQIKDHQAPQVSGVMVYPVAGKGIASHSPEKREIPLRPTGKNKKTEQQTEPIEAWGEIGFAIKCYDRMDQTSNVYGVRKITLSVDGEEIFRSDAGRFAFSDTRYINSLTDYALWKTKRSFFIKSFIEPGNKLPFLSARNRGIVNIQEERIYTFIYTLSDDLGNTTRIRIPVKGKKQDIPAVPTAGKELFLWSKENRFGAKGIRMVIPQGNLYQSFYQTYSVREDSTRLAPTHYLHDEPVALHGKARLSLRLNPQADTLADKRQYGIVQWNKGKANWIGGTYSQGWVNGEIRELGAYTVRQDTEKPVITPLQPANWNSRNGIRFKLSDNLSGVETYRGEIDGKFALFEMDKHSVVRYYPKKNNLPAGKHQLKLVVTDACGNTAVYQGTYLHNPQAKRN